MLTIIAYTNYNERYSRQQINAWSEIVKTKLPNVKYIGYASIQDIFPKLSDPAYNINYINIDLEILKRFDPLPHSLITTLKTLIESTVHRDHTGKTKKRNTKILGTVYTTTPVEHIKELLPLLDGLCLGCSEEGFVLEDIIKDQQKIIEGDLSIPKQIQCMLRKAKKREDTSKNINLTARQSQVYSLITKRGASNKVIAKTLNISESTVKLHIGAILKKYGLRNRTQLAVFSKET